MDSICRWAGTLQSEPFIWASAQHCRTAMCLTRVSYARASMTVRAALVAVLAVFPLAHSDSPLRFVSDEADAALAILQARAAGRTPTAAQWASLFSTEGYRALARRESSFGRPYSTAVF